MKTPLKRLFALLLLCVLALSLVACSQKAEKPAFTEETLPRIDGSTATIPLSEGLVSDLLGFTPEEAQEFVRHNTTHYAYENLINGDCDIIFVTPPSDEELQLMAESGQEFEVVRVVKDAFVFLTNTENPVEDISLENIKKIYKGEIKNWKELGGADEAIIPFQREDNSGSQTLMYKLVVPKSEIMEAPSELVIEGMGGLVDQVSDYDSGRASIGYSVYYYANGMYVKEGSHLISIDGVLPTDESIAKGDYPLVDGYYAVFRKDEGKNSPVRRLLSYILSPAGQKIAKKAGYVPNEL